MRFSWSTLLLQTINFGVLIWLLQRFLYRPVLRMVDARRAQVEAELAAAAKATQDAAAARDALVAAKASIGAAREAALREAAAAAEQAAAGRHAKAEQEAAALLDDARKTLADERSAAAAALRGEAARLAAAMAGRLLADIAADLPEATWRAHALRHLRALAPEAQAQLARPGTAAALRIVSASAVTEAEAEAWRAELHALLPGLAVDFATDPALIAGVDLHFPTAIMRFSWQSRLAALQDGIAAHDAAR